MPSPLIESKSISMASANIKIQVPSAKVRVVYKFTNHSEKSQEVTMAFPEEGYDAYLDEANKTYFKSFKSYVNGKEVKVKALKRKEDAEALDFGYKIWWTKNVSFKANETIEVINEYQSRPGGNTMAMNFVDYIVNTASTWHGPIKSLRIEVDNSGLAKGTKYIATPNPHKVQNNAMLWYFTDVEPTHENDVQITWEEKPGQFNNDQIFIDMFGRHPLVKN